MLETIGDHKNIGEKPIIFEDCSLQSSPYKKLAGYYIDCFLYRVFDNFLILEMVNIIRKFVMDLKGVLSPVFSSNKYADEEMGDKRRMLFCINLELYRREDIKNLGVLVFSGTFYNSPADQKPLVPR